MAASFLTWACRGERTRPSSCPDCGLSRVMQYRTPDGAPHHAGHSKAHGACPESDISNLISHEALAGTAGSAGVQVDRAARQLSGDGSS